MLFKTHYNKKFLYRFKKQFYSVYITDARLNWLLFCSDESYKPRQLSFLFSKTDPLDPDVEWIKDGIVFNFQTNTSRLKAKSSISPISGFNINYPLYPESPNEIKNFSYSFEPMIQDALRTKSVDGFVSVPMAVDSQRIITCRFMKHVDFGKTNFILVSRTFSLKGIYSAQYG